VADNGVVRCTTELTGHIFGQGFGVITDIENGPDGSLYVVSGTQRAIYRIAPAPGAVPDLDADGVDDTCDCDAADPGAFAPPVAVPRLRLAQTPATHLSWASQAATAGAGTLYTIATGSLAALHADPGFASSCTLGAGLAETALVDPLADPAAGDGRWYLVRAGTGCASGTFGDGTGEPDPRDILDAGPFPACQR
jgi:hypothetical protein